MPRAPVAAACSRARLIGKATTVALAIASLSACVAASPAAAQTPVPGAPIVIDGPSSDIVGLSGISVARDGTGGIVYTRQILGTRHVFLSRLVAGVFQPPQQVDVGLPDASSQPVIAAGNGGLLLVAFLNDDDLYVVEEASATTTPTAPAVLAAGAQNPAIAMTNFGKAYLAFTIGAGGAHDVRAAYYVNGQWGLEPTPLDAVPADDAGAGTGRPSIAAASDGIGIVSWGEGGHIYVRRVWGTSPSLVFYQADVPSLGALNEVSADQPQVAAGGDSSYVGIAFHELFSNGAEQRSRVLARRLVASVFDPVMQPDGVGGSSSPAGDPRIAMGEFGRGLITSTHQDSGQVFAGVLGTNAVGAGTLRVDSLDNTAAPDAVPAMAGARIDLIAWQQSSGGVALPEIRVRYSSDAVTFGPELVLSSPALGPTDADLGLAAAGDYSGNAAVAWVQGTGDSTEIVADQLYEPPSNFVASTRFRYVRSARPRLTWSVSRDHWGPVQYAVTIDSGQVFHTRGTSLVPPTLLNGQHTWVVTASNPAGLTASTRVARVWVDTVPPLVGLSFRGVRQVGRTIRVFVTTDDHPPGVLAASASGTVSITVRWGTGKSARIDHSSSHVFTKPGRYKLTVVATDRAGNKTTVVRTLTIKPKPKPKPKKKKKGKPPPKTHHAKRAR